MHGFSRIIPYIYCNVLEVLDGLCLTKNIGRREVELQLNCSIMVSCLHVELVTNNHGWSLV